MSLRWLGSLRAHVGDVERSAAALALTAVVSSSLGLGFWVVATRRVEQETVGRNAALLAAVMLGATAGEVGLKNGLVRFSGVAGRSLWRLVGGAYAVSAVLGVSVALLLEWVATDAVGDLDGLGPGARALFVGSVALWSIFVLQDGVLTGVGRASWVLAENAVFGLAKLGLLLVLTAEATAFGIFRAWMVPVPFLIVAMHVALLAVHRVRPDDGRAWTAGELGRYVGTDVVAVGAWRAAQRGLPLIVTVIVGAAATATYHIAWSIAYVPYLLVSSVGDAVIADGARRWTPDRVARTLRLNLAVVTPLALAMILAAPLILGVFGSDYREGAPLLRLLAASAIPYAVTGSMLAAARVEQRLGRLLVSYLSLVGIVLVGSVVLGQRYGLVGIGVSWVIAQSAVALGLTIATPMLWGPLAAHPDVRRLRARVTQPRVARRSRRDRSELLAATGCSPADVAWVTAGAGLLVGALEPHGASTGSLVRISRSHGGRATIAANAGALAAMHRTTALAGWRSLLPVPIAVSHDGERSTGEETLLPGVDGETLVRAGHRADGLVALAAQAIRELHGRTAMARPMSDAELKEIVDRPIEQIVGVRRGAAALLEPWREELWERLRDPSLVLARVHGDLCLRNVLFTGDGTVVSGVVDWERSRPDGLPDSDLLALELTTRSIVGHRELGVVVREAMADPSSVRLDTPNDCLPADVLLRMTWLDHVGGNLRRSPDFARNRVWVTMNLDPVLDAARLQPVTS